MNLTYEHSHTSEEKAELLQLQLCCNGAGAIPGAQLPCSTLRGDATASFLFTCLLTLQNA